MKNVVLTRIDDRLLHGQVIVSWIPFFQINEIIIVDDEYAQDEFMSAIIKEAAPSNITVSVLSVASAKEYLNMEDDGKRVMILCRMVEYVEDLLNANVPLKKVNVGGLGSKAGRNKFLKSIHLSEDELSILKKISENGTVVEVQMLPGDKAVEILPS